jgi:uncharacterized phage infection (PIP) family protein YhgE
MLNFAKDLAAALDALRRHAILFLLGVTLIALAFLGRSWLDARDATARLAATLAAQQKTISDADQRQSTRDAQLAQTLTQISAAKQKVQTPSQAVAALPQAVSQLIAEGPSGRPLPSPITIEIPAPDFVAQVGLSGLGPLDANHSKSQQGSSVQQFSTNGTTTNSSTRSTSAAQTNSPPSTNSSALENLLGNLSNAPNNSSTNSAANANSGSPSQSATTTHGTSAPPAAIITVPQDDLKPLYDAVQDCRACQAKLTVAQADLSDERTKFAAATAQRDAAIRVARGTFWKRTRTAAKWIVIGAAAGALLSRYH